MIVRSEFPYLLMSDVRIYPDHPSAAPENNNRPCLTKYLKQNYRYQRFFQQMQLK